MSGPSDTLREYIDRGNQSIRIAAKVGYWRGFTPGLALGAVIVAVAWLTSALTRPEPLGYIRCEDVEVAPMCGSKNTPVVMVDLSIPRARTAAEIAAIMARGREIERGK